MKKKICLYGVIILAHCSAFSPLYGNDAISSPELTDVILPRIDPKISAQFYQMLKDIDLLLKDRGISYWLTAGTLLGAVRHQGMIPWDDDMDLAFFEKDLGAILSLRSELKKLGYDIFVNRDYLKIYLSNGRIISKEEKGDCPWKYPFVDLFPMKQYGDKVSYASERLYQSFATNDWFYYSDVSSSLVFSLFGSLQVPIPSHASEYLERVYGQDVWDIAYADYDHSQEKKMPKTKVRLITRECAPDFSMKN